MERDQFQTIPYQYLPALGDTTNCAVEMVQVALSVAGLMSVSAEGPDLKAV